MTEKYFTVDSDLLIKTLVDGGYIQKLGTGSRFDDDCTGMHNDHWRADNTYNWELCDEDDDDTRSYYSLSNDFEIREDDSILMLSKHIGTDIRAGYEDEVIYLKNEDYDAFYGMVYEVMLQIAVEDKNA